MLDLTNSLRHSCFSALVRAEWRWLSRRRPSDHATVILEDIGRIGVGINQILSAIAAILSSIIFVGAGVLLSWRIALIAIAVGALVFLVFAKTHRRGFLLGQELSIAHRKMYGQLHEALNGVRQIKIIGGEERSLSNFAETMGTVRARQISFLSDSSSSRAFMLVLGAGALASMMYIGYVILGEPLATLLPFVIVFARLVPTLSVLQQAWHAWLNTMPALKQAERLIYEAEQFAEPPVAANVISAMQLKREISLQNVCIQYAGRETLALDSVSLGLPIGSATVILGASGAGKSTLADVLIGLLQPDTGKMQVDDVVIDNELRRQWRGAVAYVQQDAFIFHGTIRDNLVLAHPNCTDADLQEALSLAGASFVFELPNGVDTLIGDGGLRLSGGERQRIALARGLLGKPALLILDEVTSALDPQNRALVRNTISALRGTTTMLIISHDEEIVEMADQVIRIEGGRSTIESAPNRQG
jgi:ATP-binding cassette subfamily C protein